MSSSDGPKLMLAEIKRRGITRAAAADELGVSPVTLHFWIKEAHRPTGPRPALIAAWSGGRVPEGSWRSVEERAALKEVRKFSKAVGS
jgi:transposase-like protein